MQPRRLNIDLQLQGAKQSLRGSYGYASHKAHKDAIAHVAMGASVAGLGLFFLLHTRGENPIAWMMVATSLAYLCYLDEHAYFAKDIAGVAREVQTHMDTTNAFSHTFPIYESRELALASHRKTISYIAVEFAVLMLASEASLRVEPGFLNIALMAALPTLIMTVVGKQLWSHVEKTVASTQVEIGEPYPQLQAQHARFYQQPDQLAEVLAQLALNPPRSPARNM